MLLFLATLTHQCVAHFETQHSHTCTYSAPHKSFPSYYSYVQVELDAKKSELASQRIAFEEEKLARLDMEGHAADSEAEALRLKLKEQVQYIWTVVWCELVQRACIGDCRSDQVHSYFGKTQF